jgi:hypothetical protein
LRRDTRSRDHNDSDEQHRNLTAPALRADNPDGVLGLLDDPRLIQTEIGICTTPFTASPTSWHWLEAHRRVHFDVTPTSASWMNIIEIWFSILTKQQVRCGVYHDGPELIAAIERYIDG